MMNSNENYRTITREQFLFSEMRIVAKLLMEEKTDNQIIQEITENNLFQYPTERMIKNIAQVCLNRINKSDSHELIDIVANDSADAAKQACLFLMMNYYRLVYEFMVTVIGEKYRTKDTSFTKVDMNSFFTRLQEQNDTVASWSDATIKKCKSVLKKILIENGYLDNSRSEVLNPVLLDFRVKEAIENTNNQEVLIAFGCM